MAGIERSAVGRAFDRTRAVYDEGEAVLDGVAAGALVADIHALQAWLSALRSALNGALCPTKITQKETASGLMLDEHTPGPVYLEFAAEHQAT